MASIIGIDLGTFKSVTCVYDSETTEASFATIPPGLRHGPTTPIVPFVPTPESGS